MAAEVVKIYVGSYDEKALSIAAINPQGEIINIFHNFADDYLIVDTLDERYTLMIDTELHQTYYYVYPDGTFKRLPENPWKKSLIPKGTIWNWMSLIPPPDGWDFYPSNTRYFNFVPLPIIATRDHDSYPVISEEFMTRLEGLLSELPQGVSGQGRLAGKTTP